MRKGEVTRAHILGHAAAIAAEVGLEGLSIGGLATRAGLSKSGLFAHFGSREELQLAVLRDSVERFSAEVFRPAMSLPRGVARLRALFEGWLRWVQRSTQPGGCVILAATIEFDDRPGPVRDALVASQGDLRATLAKSVQLSIDCGELGPETDPLQVVFEISGIVLSAHHDLRLFSDPDTEKRARSAFEALLARHATR